MFSERVAKTSLRREAIWAEKELIDAKVCFYGFKKENGKKSVCSFNRSNHCWSHVAKGVAAMTSGPFCHEHGGGRSKN